MKRYEKQAESQVLKLYSRETAIDTQKHILKAPKDLHLCLWELCYQLGTSFIYMHMYAQMHIHTHTDLQCMPHVKATYVSTGLQPCTQLKKCSISLVHLLPRHEELVHTSHAQKVRHEQTPLIPANAESREASALVIKLQSFRC